ncbi:MAG: hypothetical protein KF850_40850 [Labilithrix sp.]|nr:hypothetical protein [Labilithrix sp.]
MLRRDYLERMIQQLADTLARAVGLAKEGKHEEAARDVDSLYDRNVGLPRRMLERLDLGSVRSMLGGEKLAALVLLLEAEAELRRLRGDEAGAAERERRALALRQEG